MFIKLLGHFFKYTLILLGNVLFIYNENTIAHSSVVIKKRRKRAKTILFEVLMKNYALSIFFLPRIDCYESSIEHYSKIFKMQCSAKFFLHYCKSTFGNYEEYDPTTGVGEGR